MAGILASSTSALFAFQRALSTISNNVANVSTPGYSRQRIELSGRTPQAFGSGFVGNGVQVDTIRRLTDEFVTNRLLESGAEVGRLSQLSRLSSTLDASFTDPATSLSQPWSNFFDAAQAVASDPSSTSSREAFLASATTMAARFRYLDSQLDSMENEVNQRLRAGAEQVSSLASEVARLNQEITRLTGAGGGQPPNDLLDQRDRLIDQLSGLVGVSTTIQDDGALNVYTNGGQALVVGNRSLNMIAVQDPFRPQRLNIAIEFSGNAVTLPDSALNGELGGLVEFRRDVLDPTNRAIGQLATSTAYLFNATNARGVDLYGDPGAPIFNQPAITPLPLLANTGTATLSASISNISAVASNDIELRFDGATWTARDPNTGAPLPLSGTGAPGDPFVVQGVSMVLGGTANAGDAFLIQPTAGAAGQLQLVMSDPRRIAAASPLRMQADINNLGDAIPSFSVTNPFNPGLNTPITIDFIDASNYTINGGPAIAWAPGDVIAMNGWELRLEGSPAAGDQFTVQPTGPNSSDNTNGRVLASLDDALNLNAGTGSLNITLRQMVSSIGASARGAEFSQQAQDAIQGQLVAQRESVSGVNLDEEAANMLKFQQAYQAAASMISTADTIFQSLLSAVQR